MQQLPDINGKVSRLYPIIKKYKTAKGENPFGKVSQKRILQIRACPDADLPEAKEEAKEEERGEADILLIPRKERKIPNSREVIMSFPA